MISPALYSSKTDDWSTPQDFFDKLNEEFHFTLDVCATPENAKCARYYTKEQNGLIQGWADDAEGGAIWCNPPYGKDIKFWVNHAMVEATMFGATVVLLVPARTDAAWWHNDVMPIIRGQRPGEVRFVKGRLKFGGAKNSAPFPSAIVVMRPRSR